jgi:hypothetical protein
VKIGCRTQYILMCDKSENAEEKARSLTLFFAGSVTDAQHCIKADFDQNIFVALLDKAILVVQKRMRPSRIIFS